MTDFGFDLLSDDDDDDEDEGLIGAFLHLGMARASQDDKQRHHASATPWSNRPGAGVLRRV